MLPNSARASALMHRRAATIAEAAMTGEKADEKQGFGMATWLAVGAFNLY
ncbi:hypothetical protein [Paraburkholderia sp. RL17-337-BIB-A]